VIELPQAVSEVVRGNLGELGRSVSESAVEIVGAVAVGSRAQLGLALSQILVPGGGPADGLRLVLAERVFGEPELGLGSGLGERYDAYAPDGLPRAARAVRQDELLVPPSLTRRPKPESTSSGKMIAPFAGARNERMEI